MGILFKTKPAQDRLLLVRVAIPIGVLKIADVRDAEDERAVFVRKEADRNIQALGKGGDLLGAALGVELIQHHHLVPAFLVEWDGEWILAGLGDPEPALLIEGHVHGLADLRLCCDQLDFKTRRHMESFQFLLRCARAGRADELGEGIGGVKRPG